MDVGAPDVGQKVPEVLVALPGLANVTVRGPVVWPGVTRTEPQVDCVSVEVLPDRVSGKITDVCRDFSWEGDDMGVTQDAHLRTESCPLSFENLAPCLWKIIRKRRLMLDGSPLRWWSRRVKLRAILAKPDCGWTCVRCCRGIRRWSRCPFLW